MNRLDITLIWLDPDLLEIRASVRFGSYGGEEVAYVSRDELLGFASALQGIFEGTAEASLVAGQRDLTFAELRIGEYDRARHLALWVHLGRAPGTIGDPREHSWELRITVPVERGALKAFADALRGATMAEGGTAVLPLPVAWP